MRISSRTVGRAERMSSVCHSAVISAVRSRSSGLELRIGYGDAVELFEQVGDAAALEHDAAPGDLRRVRGEDRRDADAAEELMRLVGGGASLAKTAESSAQAAALEVGRMVSVQFARRRRLR